MVLSRSHLYYIKKEKTRRARVLSARIRFEYDSSAAVAYGKMIKRQMGWELNQKFGIRRLEELEDSLYVAYLREVQEYRFCYGGKVYG